MTTRALRERLAEQTRHAYGRYEAGMARSGPARPEPGDVFVLEQPGEFVVSWLVVVREQDRVLVVPADANTLVGSTDFEVTDLASGGALSLRCGLGTCLAAETLAAGDRVGSVGPGDVARARRWCREIDEGAFTGSILAREEDENPDYRDWVSRVLEPARQVLAGRGDGVPAAGSPRRLGYLAAVAAAVLLALGAGLALGPVGRQSSAVLNPAVVQLRPLDQVRGTVREVRWPAQASHLVLFLPLEEPRPSPRYRLELLRMESRSLVWANDQLIPQTTGEVRVGLPVSKLEPGEYRLRLVAPEDGRVTEYGLRVGKNVGDEP